MRLFYFRKAVVFILIIGFQLSKITVINLIFRIKVFFPGRLFVLRLSDLAIITGRTCRALYTVTKVRELILFTLKIFVILVIFILGVFVVLVVFILGVFVVLVVFFLRLLFTAEQTCKTHERIL